MASGKRWTRDELLIALNIYHKLTFGQFHARNPVIIELATKLDRTPDSLAMKLCNLASLDPALKLRGIKGLEGASNLDRTIWEEFHSDLNETVPDSENLLRNTFGADETNGVEIIPRKGVRIVKRPDLERTEVVTSAKQRRGQEYFRNAVLNNFAERCGVCGLNVRELLIASHILPWNAHSKHRLDVRNGLSLSRLHDAAFDQGLIAFDDNLRLMLSPRLKDALPQRAVAENFAAYEGEALTLPDDSVLPEPSFLAKHRAKVFRL
ncbi:MAG: HNH endonuclease [Verrucomicrobiota bacterium]